MEKKEINKIDEGYIRLFNPLPKGEFLEIREDYSKSVWISSINQLKKYEIDKNKEIFIQQHSKGNNRNRKSENSASIKHLFFDIDYIKDLSLAGESTGYPYIKYYKLELVLRDIRLLGLPEPSLVVHSGGGFHVYFELKKRIYKDITPILKEIALKINADTRATDKARIMRLAGSINHKKEYNKPEAKIIYKTNFTYDLELFEKIANRKAKKNNIKELNIKNEVESKEYNNISEKKYRHSKLTPAIDTNMHCVNKLLEGVKEGNRNFALGRITKKLQQMGYREFQAKKVVMSWNTDNNPPEEKNKLLSDFKKYWDEDYKLLGCMLNNFELKKDLKHICNKDKCKLRKKTFSYGIKREKVVTYSNKLFKKNRYHNLSGNALIVLGILKQNNGKLSRDDLKNKLTSNITTKQSISNRLLSKNLKELDRYKLIQIKKKYGEKGGRKSDLIIVKEKKKFNLGYTLINNHIIKKFIDKTMTQTEFKVYLLLRSYIFAGKNSGWPNQEEMANRLRVSQQTVSEHLNNLEKKEIIEIKHVQTQKGYLKCIYKI